MEDEPVSGGDELAWPGAKRRGRKPRPPIQEGDILFGGHVAKLQKALASLRETEHGNRKLHYDSVVTALLLAFYNPACRSLRTIEDFSQLDSTRQQTDIDRICKSTNSDALACFDPALLLPIIKDLKDRLPPMKGEQADLAEITQQIIATDGSYFNIYSDVAWALHLTRSNGRDAAEIRANVQVDIRLLAPLAMSISGDDGVSEGDAAIPDLVEGAIYLGDRGYVNFTFFSAVLAKKSDFVVRGKSNSPAFCAQQERELTQADRDHGVVSDRVGILTGRGAPAQLLREVTIVVPEAEHPVRLITSLLDLSARLIGVLYRQRWQIELFFRWLKVWANFEHLISHSRNGLTIQFYIAVIGTLLMHVRTGRPVNKYSYNMMSHVAAGNATVKEILPILERRARERELERQRLARKRAQKLIK
jgi:hypothetical protein